MRIIPEIGFPNPINDAYRYAECEKMSDYSLTPEETEYFCDCLAEVFSSYFDVPKDQALSIFERYGVREYVSEHRTIGHSNNDTAMRKIVSIIEYNGGPKIGAESVADKNPYRRSRASNCFGLSDFSAEDLDKIMDQYPNTFKRLDD